MDVQGYLSLYTLLLAFKQYDAFWNILTMTGLVLIPFAVIAVRSVSEPFLSMGAKNAGQIAQRRWVTSTVMAVIVLMLAGVPMVKLDASVLHYKPACNSRGEVATPGHTGTTYDKVLPIAKNVKVPIFWYFILAIANGLTDAMKETIACQPINFRALQTQVDLTNISNPALKAQVMQFYNQCYLPAYDQYIQDNNNHIDQNQFEHFEEIYGPTDIGWIGSETFQNVHGFYDTHYAKNPVPGFAYNSNTINNQIQGQVGKPRYGIPTCKAWWQQSNVGLRDQLLHEFSDRTRSMFARLDYMGPASMTQNAAIRVMVTKATGGGMFSKGYASQEDSGHGLNHIYGELASRAGLEFLKLFEVPTLTLIKNSLPIVQACLLFFVISLLAIALPISCYSMRFCVTAASLLFSIIFCSYIWHLVTWLDHFLLTAMYGIGEGFSNQDPFVKLYHYLDPVVNPQIIMINLVIGGLYVVTPAILTGLLGMSGYKLGGIFSLSSMGAGFVASGGQHGGQVASRVAGSTMHHGKQLASKASGYAQSGSGGVQQQTFGGASANASAAAKKETEKALKLLEIP